MKEAIILAGGLGTRLRQITGEVPKPLAPVCGRPFLEHLLRYLAAEGIARVCLAVGYRCEMIMEHFGQEFAGMELVYSIESEPLGTGGALRQALELMHAKDILVLNGDTLFRIPLQQMFDAHQAEQSKVTLALKPARQASRFGSVQVIGGKIMAFGAAQQGDCHYINGGVYILQKDLLRGADLPERFSFEADFLQPEMGNLDGASFISDAYFIDIGVPEDYHRADRELCVN